MKDYRSSIHGIGSRMRRILLMLIDVILIVSVYSFCFYYCRLEYFNQREHSADVLVDAFDRNSVIWCS